ncbi:hypothetical protein BJX76DRAFT_320706 [Aspergillus varians]
MDSAKFGFEFAFEVAFVLAFTLHLASCPFYPVLRYVRGKEFGWKRQRQLRT